GKICLAGMSKRNLNNLTKIRMALNRKTWALYAWIINILIK
ncbi:hypothetical protein N325_01320, partial [Colius striatus]